MPDVADGGVAYCCRPAFAAERWTRERPTSGTTTSLGWSAPTTFRPAPSTSWRCGKADSLRRGHHRQGAGLGPVHRHEHHARVPAQPAVGAGREGLQTAHRCVSCAIAAKHGIKPMFVLFDSCWDPEPKLGPQRPPIPGVHQLRLGAGCRAARDWKMLPVIPSCGSTAGRRRCVCEGSGASWRGMCGTSRTMTAAATTRNTTASRSTSKSCCAQVFDWARSQKPDAAADQRRAASRRLVVAGQAERHREDPDHAVRCDYVPRLQLARYRFERRVKQLQAYGRPLLCTEYMARRRLNDRSTTRCRWASATTSAWSTGACAPLTY